MRFVTSVYGQRHVNMLLPLLSSIEDSNPTAQVSVYWEEIDAATISLLSHTFPRVEFVETNFRFGADITRRISSKTTTWEFAALRHVNELVCFLDADMLVVRSLAELFSGRSFDILITDKSGQFPINSGVVVAQMSPVVLEFFRQWNKQTKAVLDSKELSKQANSRLKPYGGADQMALQQLIGYTYGISKYKTVLGSESVRVESIDCRYMNETESRPITKQTHIIHYKGGWRSILFEGGYFTKNRSKHGSWPMFIMYLTTFRRAVSKVNHATQKNYSMGDFGLHIPFYINPTTFRERQGQYMLFFLVAWTRALPKRIYGFVRARLS